MGDLAGLARSAWRGLVVRLWADGARHPGRCADRGQLGPADSALPFSVAGVLSFALCVFSWFGLCRVNMY